MSFFKKLFQYNNFKHNINKNKEIENSNSGFIVVRHFLAYVYSPPSPNRVRVPLTCNFNQASNLLTLRFRLQWALTQSFQDSNLLKTLTLSFYKNEFLNLAQRQNKARMTHKGALKDMQVKFNAQRKKWELLRQKQVGRQINASVFYIINEVELSIYRFLSLGAKNSKR